MEKDLKLQIFNIIESARQAREKALNPDGSGYPFVAGYATASLEEIYRLVKAAR